MSSSADHIQIQCHLDQIEFIQEIRSKLESLHSLFDNSAESIECVTIRFKGLIFDIHTVYDIELDRIQKIQELFPNYSFTVVKADRVGGHHETTIRGSERDEK